MESLAARFELVEHLAKRAHALAVTAASAVTAALVVAAAALISSDITHHATVAGLNPAHTALAVTVAAAAVKGLFAGLAALIRSRPAVPDVVGRRPYGEPR